MGNCYPTASDAYPHYWSMAVTQRWPHQRSTVSVAVSLHWHGRRHHRVFRLFQGWLILLSSMRLIDMPFLIDFFAIWCFQRTQDDKVASNRVLCIIILAIWSWSLLQFTMVLTASPTKSKKSKSRMKDKKPNCCHTAKNVCCSVDVWSILINIILQDAPFFIFRLLLILHYKIISETNIFFTCKVSWKADHLNNHHYVTNNISCVFQNTLVITLQFYRLIVVQAEKRKGFKSSKQGETVIGKNQVMSNNASKKRGTSPGSGAVDSSRNLRSTKIVKVASGPVSVRGKSPKSPKRAVAKLVRTASEDDGAAVYPAHGSSFLLHTENDTSWRQYSRVRIRLYCYVCFRNTLKDCS